MIDAGGLRDTFRERLWPLGLVYAAVVVPVVLHATGGRYVGDNRFELYWNPARRVARSFSAWDGSRGMGRVREDFWPGATAPPAALRALGFPPWAAEALFHALLLVVLGLGVVAVLRLFRPRIGTAHVVAGALAIASPYSAGFLLPSQLFMHAAIAPWLVVLAYRGVHSAQPWRWAAGFALVTFLFGNTDPPGATYAMLPTGVMLAYVVVVARSARLRDVAGWGARAGVLALLVNLVALSKLGLAAATFAQRLNDTETPETAALTSSWAESWRGLGFWLLYFRDATGLARPQTAWYFGGAFAVLVTYLVPLGSMATLWATRWRPRLLFAAMAVVALVIMVGGYPLENPPPLGSAVLSAYEQVPGLAAFRNTYKAGAGLVIGLSILAGVGVASALSWLRRQGDLALRAGYSVVAVSLLLIAMPLLRGELYDPAETMSSVPQHWRDALAWLDAESATSGRVLVLPAATRADYRWGWPGDDIFDALLARDHAIDTSIPLSTPRAAGLLHTVSTMPGPEYQAGTFAPLLRRMGIDTVVLRNDLHWEQQGVPRPADHDGLRSDADLVAVAAFGASGLHTTSPDDTSALAQYERTLAPVEVYRLVDPGPGVALPDVAPLLLAGDSAAWPDLAASGMLDDHRTVQYTADLDAASLLDSLERGARVAVTDSNRRRMDIVAGFVAEASHTLAAGQDLERTASDLFAVPGSQSVATFGDATVITASGQTRTIGGFRPWYRPANAFDGLPETSWRVPIAEQPVGRALRLDLEEPTSIENVVIVDSTLGRGGTRIARVALRFSDGSSEVIEIVDGTAAEDFRARTTQWVEIEILGIAGTDAGGGVGFAEIAFAGVDAVEFIRVPDDLRRVGEAREGVRQALAAAPLSILLRREQGSGPVPEEAALRREVWAPGDRSMRLEGLLAIGAGVPDAFVADLVPTAVRAVGSQQLRSDRVGVGVLAVDGDLETAWLGSPESAPVLELSIGDEVQSLEIIAPATSSFSPLTEIVATRGEQSERATLVPNEACAATEARAALQCATAGTVAVPAGSGPVILSVGAYDHRLGAGLLARPIGISDVRLNGAPNEPLDRDAPLATCVATPLAIDTVGVPVRVQGSVGELLEGQPLEFESCEPVELHDGWHRIDSAASAAAVRHVTLTDGHDTVAPESLPRVTEVRRGPAFIEFEVQAPAGGILTTGQSWDERWVAHLDEVLLGQARPMDTLGGWRLPPGTDGTVVLTFEAQRRFDRSLALSAVGLLICGWLVLRPVRRTEEEGHVGAIAPSPAPRARELSNGLQAALLASAAVVGTLSVGVTGGVVAAAAVVAGLMSPVARGRPAAAGALLLLIVAALATAFGAPIGVEELRLNFASQRPLAAQAGALAGVLGLVAVILGSLEERAASPARAVRDPVAARLRRARRALPQWLRAHTALGAPALLGAFVALLVRTAVAPAALAPSSATLFAQIDMGIGYDLHGPAGGLGPLPASLAAFSPLGPQATLVLLSSLLVAIASVVAGRVGGARSAWMVAVVLALSPAGWGLRLPEVLVSLFVLLGIERVVRSGPVNWWAVGALFGAAALCRPEALVIFVALVAWIAFTRGAPSAGRVAVGGALFVSPWLRWLVLDQGAGPTLAPTDAIAHGLLVGLSSVAVLGGLAYVGLHRASSRHEWLAIGFWGVLVGADLVTGGGRGFGATLLPVAVVALAIAILEQFSGGRAVRLRVQALTGSRNAS